MKIFFFHWNNYVSTNIRAFLSIPSSSCVWKNSKTNIFPAIFPEKYRWIFFTCKGFRTEGWCICKVFYFPYLSSTTISIGDQELKWKAQNIIDCKFILKFVIELRLHAQLLVHLWNCKKRETKIFFIQRKITWRFFDDIFNLQEFR